MENMDSLYQNRASAENTPNAQNLSAQKFEFSMEKSFIGRP